MTTQQKIRQWLNRDLDMYLSEGETREDITHMIVVCDTFDYSDYPVYVTKDQDVRKIFSEHNGQNMQRVMEIYSFGRDLESQLNERRAFHFD